jgi:Rod binding domain-containing protein
MSTVGDVTAPAAPHAPDNRNDPAKIANAAKQFESLLIAQILKSMHEDGSAGWMGEGEDDQSADSAMELAEEQFAQALATRGGLGLSRLIVQGLTTESLASSNRGNGDVVNVAGFTKP